MELSAEINKVFGTEMAKLFAEQISEEELKTAAEKAWHDLNKKDENVFNNYKKTSDFDKELEKQILSKFKEEVERILESEEVNNQIHEHAERLIKAIRERAEEKIIERTSNNIAAMYCGYDGYNLRGFIINAVREELG